VHREFLPQQVGQRVVDGFVAEPGKVRVGAKAGNLDAESRQRLRHLDTDGAEADNRHPAR